MHHGVAGDERGGEQAGRGRERVVPRGEHRDDTTRLRPHQVDRAGAAGQRPTGDAQTGDRCLVQQVGGDAG